MSEQIRVAFSTDMPAAAVEVVSPGMQVVDRFMLDAGRSRTVQVPSEASFLRVHLPSGQVVTLQEPGSPDREVSLADVLIGDLRSPGTAMASAGGGTTISPADLDPSDAPTVGELRRYQQARSTAVPPATEHGVQLPLGTTGGTASLLDPNGEAMPGASTSRAREAHWDLAGYPYRAPFQLRIQQPSGSALLVTVPGNCCTVWARADLLRGHSATRITVRIHSTSDAADTIVGYLSRGDLYAAEAMTEWTDHAIGMLQSKVADPYAAAVGGYLLLRLQQQPSHLHSWAQNLADWFPFLPDGCVIRARQLMQHPLPDTTELEVLLLEAVRRGVPVYTEGLRLLTDALRLMGDTGREALDTVRAATGTVVWDSPVTASVQTPTTSTLDLQQPPVIFDIAFAAKV